MIEILPFGGCGLHGPISTAYANNRHPILLRERVGYLRPPFVLTASTARQLIDFVDGRFDIPLWIRRLMYGDPHHVPNAEQVAALHSVDVALIEMSTPLLYDFEGFYLNINRFEEVMGSALKDAGIEKKLVSTWKSALLKANEDVRADAAKTMASQMPSDTEEQRDLVRFVLGTTGRQASVEEIGHDLGELRDILRVPMGMVLHNYQFMPDGRALSWPATFKADSQAIADRLNMKTFDFADFVLRKGVANVMAADRRHFNPAYNYTLGEQLYNFAAGIVGAPEFQRRTDADMSKDLAAEFNETDQVERATATPVAHATTAPARVENAPLPRYLFDQASGGHLRADDDLIHLVLLMGQAWAMGANGDSSGDAPVTSAPEYPGHALMFDTGLQPRSRTVRSFVDLYGDGDAGRAVKESPAAGMADQILRNCQARFGVKPTLAFATLADTGTSLTGVGQDEGSGLMRGSRLYAEALYYTQRARDIAQAMGKRLEVAAVCLLQGEYEAGKKGNPTEYRRSLSLLQQQLDADLRTLTGQSEPIRMLVSQTNRGAFRRKTPDIPLAQLRAQDDNSFIRCVGPTYHVEPEVRGSGPATHPKAAGYRAIGQQFGRYILDDVWGAQRSPMRVVAVEWMDPKRFRLRYPRPVALELDDRHIVVSTLGPGLGIEYGEGSKSPPTVASVRIASNDPAAVEVVLSAAPLAPGAHVVIAGRRTGGGGCGRVEGARSGIRSAEPFDTDPLLKTPLFDWACAEEVAL